MWCVTQVVEMAPSYGLNPRVRQELYDAAVKLARHVGYRNAGTVEFMVDKEDNWYFLEVNPRVQVRVFVCCHMACCDGFWPM